MKLVLQISLLAVTCSVTSASSLTHSAPTRPTQDLPGPSAGEIKHRIERTVELSRGPGFLDAVVDSPRKEGDGDRSEQLDKEDAEDEIHDIRAGDVERAVSSRMRSENSRKSRFIPPRIDSCPKHFDVHDVRHRLPHLPKSDRRKILACVKSGKSQGDVDSTVKPYLPHHSAVSDEFSWTPHPTPATSTKPKPVVDTTAAPSLPRISPASSKPSSTARPRAPRVEACPKHVDPEAIRRRLPGISLANLLHLLHCLKRKLIPVTPPTVDYVCPGNYHLQEFRRRQPYMSDAEKQKFLDCAKKKLRYPIISRRDKCLQYINDMHDLKFSMQRLPERYRLETLICLREKMDRSSRPAITAVNLPNNKDVENTRGRLPRM